MTILNQDAAGTREAVLVGLSPEDRGRAFSSGEGEPRPKNARRVVVLGVGNILLTDEGIGVRTVEKLQREFALPAEVEVIDGGTSGMELIEDLAYASHLIIVDAVRTGRPGGSIVRIAGAEVPVLFRTRMSPHQVGLPEVLAALQLTGETPGSTVVIGVEPVSLEPAMELSAPVAAQLAAVVARVAEELRALGYAVEPRRG